MFRRVLSAASRAPGVVWCATLLVTLVVVGALAVHRPHVDFGDDYALYLRQARSLIDGDIDRVVADNAFLVNAKGEATSEFTPTAYPWVTALLMAPAVRAVGPMAWDSLKLAEVAVLAAWAVLFLVFARRRVGLPAATLLTAAVALSPWYLRYTNSVLSELPYLLVATGLLLGFDRVSRSHDPLRLPWNAAWLIGVLGTLAFNTRREGLAVVPAIAAWQAVAAWRRRPVRGHLTAVAARPYVALIAAGAAFHLLLPATIFPRYGGSGIGTSLRHLAGPYRREFARLLGIGVAPTLVVAVILILATIGVVDRVRDGHDVPPTVFVSTSTVLAAGHRAVNTRYLMLAVPFVLLLAFHGWRWLADRLSPPRASGWRRVAMLAPVAVLAAHSLYAAADAARDARAFRDDGLTLLGPGTAEEDAGFDAVMRYSRGDDVVAFFKGRLMTYITDRRALQTVDPALILRDADWYLQRYDVFEPPDGSFSPFLGVPQFTPEEAAALALEEVWRNDRWVLWRIPDPEPRIP